MGSQYFQLKQVLQENAQCGDLVTTETLKKWYRQAHGEKTKLNLGHFTNQSKSKHPPLLHKKDHIKGTKNWQYEVTSAITEAVAPSERLDHYELLNQALTPYRNQELSRREIEEALTRYLAPAPLPAGLKNLGNFTKDGSNARCKDGNHLLESRAHSRYWVHIPAQERVQIYYHPELAILSKNNPADGFQTALMDIWAHRISDTPDYEAWWQASQTQKIFQKHEKESASALFKALLEKKIQLPAVQVLDLLMGVDSLQGFYDGLLEQIREQVLSHEPLRQHKTQAIDYAVNSVAQGLYQRKRLQTPLLSLLAQGPTPEVWQNCEKLYYNRLHHTRRPLERVLNTQLPQQLQAHGVAVLKGRAFLERVLQWFLGTSTKQAVNPEENWYQAGFNQRINAFEASKAIWQDKDIERVLMSLWKRKDDLNTPERFEKALKAMLKQVYSLPGFEKQTQDAYPAFYLATGLLSLLFPGAVFTLSDHSIQGLITLLNSEQELHPAFQTIQRQWLTQQDLRNPSANPLIKLLHCIRFAVVPGLQSTWPDTSAQQLTPRTLDMLVYTLRKYTPRELEAIRDKTLPDSSDRQDKIARTLFR